MWIFTKKGFVSIVEDRNDPNCLLVRSRIKGDLERIFKNALGSVHTEVSETPDADYRFRVFLPRDLVASTIQEEAQDIDYDNFKNGYRDNGDVPAAQRSLCHNHMHDVWGAMMNAQREAQNLEEDYEKESYSAGFRPTYRSVGK
jgi:hypothetical protein